VAACSASSTQGPEGGADAPDASAPSGDASPDAPRSDATAADGFATEASVSEIEIDAASFPISDGGVVHCGPDYNAVVVFYAATSDPMPTETGVVSCAAPVVIGPVEPSTAYELDVYLQKGTSIVAQATCSATTQAGESVAASCPPFM
jgi:hypothetical protein